MGTPEGKVKQFIDNKMKEWFPKAFKYSPPGGRFGKAGMPDRFWLIKAGDHWTLVVAIEAKAPDKSPTELQIITMSKLRDQGVFGHFVIGKDVGTMEMIRDGINLRLQLASEKSRP